MTVTILQIIIMRSGPGSVSMDHRSWRTEQEIKIIIHPPPPKKKKSISLFKEPGIIMIYTVFFFFFNHNIVIIIYNRSYSPLGSNNIYTLLARSTVAVGS